MLNLYTYFFRELSKSAAKAVRRNITEPDGVYFIGFELVEELPVINGCL